MQLRQVWKQFHMHWQDQFPVDPHHLLNAVFYSRQLNLPNKALTLSSSQQTSKKKGKNGRECENMHLDEKKSICVFLLHIANMPRIKHPDIWTRVSAENVSIWYV